MERLSLTDGQGQILNHPKDPVQDHQVHIRDLIRDTQEVRK